jgi:hypothetical protein
MARWRKRESLAHAVAREFGGIGKGVVKELLSIFTMGLYKPKKRFWPNQHGGRRR